MRGSYRFLFYVAALFLAYWLIFNNADVTAPRADDQSAPSVSASTSSESIYPGYESKKAFVVSIFDGDTIKTRDGEVIRYLGIDAPEMNRGKGGRPQPGAEAATERNYVLVNRKGVVLLVHPLERKDVYGRTLAYILIDKGDEYVSVNHTLVQEGHAREAYGRLRVPARIRKRRLPSH